jgi:hypothetical protein
MKKDRQTGHAVRDIANRVATFSEHRGRAFGRSLTGRFPFSVFRSRADALVTDAKLLFVS